MGTTGQLTVHYSVPVVVTIGQFMVHQTTSTCCGDFRIVDGTLQYTTCRGDYSRVDSTWRAEKLGQKYIVCSCSYELDGCRETSTGTTCNDARAVCDFAYSSQILT